MKRNADAAETHSFQAEVAELLHLMVHSVYSETDIFLRELISNASDACDKLRYEAIAKPELLATARALAIRITPDDDGRHAHDRRHRHRHGPPGADRQSRHHRPLRHARLHEPARRGQGRRRPDRPVRRRLLFGLHGRRPHRGDEPPRRARARRGSGARRAAPASRSRRRARSRPSACRAAPRSCCISRTTRSAISSRTRSSAWCRTYSDHILFPIELADGKGEPRQINAASALWQRPKSELKPEDYTQAYRTHRRRLRRAGADAALQGRGPAVLCGAAVRALDARPSTCSIRSARAG